MGGMDGDPLKQLEYLFRAKKLLNNLSNILALL